LCNSTQGSVIMIDENSPVNTNVERLSMSGLKSAGNGPSKSPQKSTRTSRGSIGKASTPLESASTASKKRVPEKSPAKSESKRLSLRKSPAPKSGSKAANDTVKNRRETVDPADLDDFLNDLDASTASAVSNKSSRSSRGSSDKAGVPAPRRSSRLSDTSTASDISGLDNMSPLPPARRLTVDAADVEALLNDSTTSSQMRELTTASPAAGRKRSSGDSSITSASSSRNSGASGPEQNSMPYQMPNLDDDENDQDVQVEVGDTAVQPPSLDQLDVSKAVESEVQFNMSGAAADDSFDDRRTTMDAADMQALLEEEDYTMNSHSSHGRPSLGGGRVSFGSVPVSRRTTVDAADMDALLESLDEEGASDISCSPPAAARDVAGPDASVEAEAEKAAEVESVSSPLHAMLQQEERRMSEVQAVPSTVAVAPVVVAPVSTTISSFRVEPSAAAAKARRNSMAPTSTTARFSLGHHAVQPRRMTADLADLKELAQELNKQHASVVEQPPAPAAAAADTAVDSPAAAAASPVDSSQDQQEEQDSIMSLGALISRRGTLETSFNSSYVGESRRESRLSVLSVQGAGGNMIMADTDGAASPVRSPVQVTQSVLKSGLKSCLSSKKTRPSLGTSAGRLSLGGSRVIFGSPKAAEFTRGAPTDALTPLARSEAKSLFSMVGSAPRMQEEQEDAEEEDEGTRENSAILEEWDRLTNTSNGEGSDEENEETDEFPLPPTPVLPGTPSDAGGSAGNSKNSSRSRKSSPRRRLSGRMPAIDLSPAMEQAQFDDAETEREGEGEGDKQQETSALNSSRMSTTSEGATGTVNLPADFADLLAQNDGPIVEAFKGSTMHMSQGDAFIAQHRQSLDTTNLSMASEEDSRTMALETDLQGVLRHVDYTEQGVNDASRLSTGSAQTCSSEGSGHSLGGVLGLSTSGPAPVSSASASASAAAPAASSDAMMMASPSGSAAFPYMSTDRMSFRPGSIGNNSMSMRSDRFSLDASPVLKEIVMQQQMQESSPLASPSPADFSRQMSMSAVKASPLPIRVTTTRQSFMAPTPTSTISSAAAAQYVPSSAGASKENAVLTNAASSILSRLRNLNDGSRRSTLSNAVGTPGASRFSIGAKRAALSASATKAASATKPMRDISAASMHTTAAMESLRYADPEVSVIHTVQGAESIGGDDNESDASADTVQEEEAPVEFDLHEVLTAADLGASESIADSGSGLLAALKLLQTQISPQLLNQVSTAMLENVQAAVQQAAEVPADITRLQDIWARAPKEAHEHVRALQQKPARYSGNPASPSASASDNQLVKIGKQCKSIVAKQWGNWEGELLNAGTSVISAMYIQTNKQKQQILSETQALRAKIAAIQAKQAAQETPAHNAQRANELQQRIQAAREQIDKSRSEAETLAEEYSQLLEQRKQAIVTLARDISHKAVNEKQKEARAAERQQELTDEYNGLAETQRLVGVLNRLSHYRTTSYKSNGIVVEVALTAKVRAQVSFTMESGPMGLEVSDVQVELMQYGAVEAGDSESEMAHAFFRDYMANNANGGPLSSAILAQVDTPREIPELLQRVSGQVIALRRALSALTAFSTDGYTWALHGENVIVTFPGGKYTLSVPVRQTLTGGVMQLTHHALRSTATGEPIAEYPMKAVVSSLRMRYGPTDRGHFQPFPARAVRKEVEAIVKHV